MVHGGGCAHAPAEDTRRVVGQVALIFRFVSLSGARHRPPSKCGVGGVRRYKAGRCLIQHINSRPPWWQPRSSCVWPLVWLRLTWRPSAQDAPGSSDGRLAGVDHILTSQLVRHGLLRPVCYTKASPPGCRASGLAARIENIEKAAILISAAVFKVQPTLGAWERVFYRICFQVFREEFCSHETRKPSDIIRRTAGP